jgi:hypothetical protein
VGSGFATYSFDRRGARTAARLEGARRARAEGRERGTEAVADALERLATFASRAGWKGAITEAVAARVVSSGARFEPAHLRARAVLSSKGRKRRGPLELDLRENEEDAGGRALTECLRWLEADEAA